MDYKKCMWNLIENIKGKYVKGVQVQMLHYIWSLASYHLRNPFICLYFLHFLHICINACIIWSWVRYKVFLGHFRKCTALTCIYYEYAFVFCFYLHFGLRIKQVQSHHIICMSFGDHVHNDLLLIYALIIPSVEFINNISTCMHAWDTLFSCPERSGLIRVLLL